MALSRARSSAGERSPHTREVAGSNPAAPTSAGWRCIGSTSPYVAADATADRVTQPDPGGHLHRTLLGVATVVVARYDTLRARRARPNGPPGRPAPVTRSSRSRATAATTSATTRSTSATTRRRSTRRLRRDHDRPTQDLDQFDLDLRDSSRRYARRGRQEHAGCPEDVQELASRRGEAQGAHVHGRGRLQRRPADGRRPGRSLEGWVKTSDGAFVVNEPQGSPAGYPGQQRPKRQGDLRLLDHGPAGQGPAIGNGRPALLGTRRQDDLALA